MMSGNKKFGVVGKIFAAIVVIGVLTTLQVHAAEISSHEILMQRRVENDVGPEVEIAMQEAERAIDDVSVIYNAENYLLNPDFRVNDKTKVFAASLWKDVREFLVNKNIDHNAKNELVGLLTEVGDYIKSNHLILKEELKICTSAESEVDNITCYKQTKQNAYELAFKRFPELNAKVNELSIADCKKKCERPTSIVPVFIGNDL